MITNDQTKLTLTSKKNTKLVFSIEKSQITDDYFVNHLNGNVKSYVGMIRDNNHKKCIITLNSVYRDPKHPVFIIINKILNDEPVSFDIKVA
jgi:hypothetical protein